MGKQCFNGNGRARIDGIAGRAVLNWQLKDIIGVNL
ncbi:MAG: hypothetical protein RLZZ519_2239 [Bacteroidota bacterium]|jgi:hypothetical protein